MWGWHKITAFAKNKGLEEEDCRWAFYGLVFAQLYTGIKLMAGLLLGTSVLAFLHVWGNDPSLWGLGEFGAWMAILGTLATLLAMKVVQHERAQVDKLLYEALNHEERKALSLSVDFQPPSDGRPRDLGQWLDFMAWAHEHGLLNRINEFRLD